MSDWSRNLIPRLTAMALTIAVLTAPMLIAAGETGTSTAPGATGASSSADASGDAAGNSSVDAAGDSTGVTAATDAVPSPVPSSREEAETTIASLSQQEADIYAQLFQLNLDIQASESERVVAQRSLDDLRAQSERLRQEIAETRTSRENNMEALRALLTAWQRSGPGSSLEMLLDASDLADFLRRVNLLSDFSDNVERIDAEIEQDEIQLEARQDALVESETRAEEAVLRIEALIAQKDALRAEQETLMAALAEQRSAAEDWLAGLDAAWQALKPRFPTASAVFAAAMSEGAFPEDAVSVSVTLEGIAATLPEAVLAGTLKANADFPDLMFRFDETGVHVTDSNGELLLDGAFEPYEEKQLLFVPETGTFRGMPLEPEALSELFSEGNLIFDLTPVLAFGRITAVRTEPGLLVLTLR